MGTLHVVGEGKAEVEASDAVLFARRLRSGNSVKPDSALRYEV